jgi:hypothetical protein
MKGVLFIKWIKTVMVLSKYSTNITKTLVGVGEKDNCMHLNLNRYESIFVEMF